MLLAVAIALLDSSSLRLGLDDSGFFPLPPVAFSCLHLGGFWDDLLTPVDLASSGWPQSAPVGSGQVRLSPHSGFLCSLHHVAQQ